ncbi:MAG: putative manganese transporter [Eubacteriales bacterium]|nr:putative manganese transporter [Eubacteriales bacterium]
MIDVILDTLIDSVKLLPFLFLTYLAMEYLEHRTSTKTKRLIKNSGKAGPFIGALLGAFPQCGFSAAASNLYAGRVITMGTLISIYLSTSDEMLPVFISENVAPLLILKIIGAKVVIGMAAGFIIDSAMRRINIDEDVAKKIGHICDHDHCHCDKSIVKSALKHTAIIFGYIVAISFMLNTVIFFVGEDTLGNLILNKPVIGPLLATAVGLVPNCAASVVLTQLYIGGVMSLGSMMAGLLAGAGVGILVLFRENRELKNSFQILGIMYAIGAVCGIIIDAVMMMM